MTFVIHALNYQIKILVLTCTHTKQFNSEPDFFRMQEEFVKHKSEEFQWSVMAKGHSRSP